MPKRETGSLANCHLRLARRQDIAAIEAVLVNSYTEFRDFVSPMVFDLYRQDMVRLAERWGEAAIIVAETDGGIAGVVSFYEAASAEGLGPSPDASEFRWLAVLPAERGKGIGRLLVDECVRRARAHGAAAVVIRSASFMTSARRIYESAGFRRSPGDDLRVSDVLKLSEDVGEVIALAYRLDIAPA